ncbi:hypothetical protein DFH09DRAFT_1441573 [Mycena vulgaris]|nr:hypothetical protein DFH09DRAFT_1441573 [Mycena vulgaris]
MSLLKKGSDEWTPTGIKSTFWIIIPASTDLIPPGTVPSAVCGLGWRFLCDANLESSSRSTVFVDADGDTLPAWRIAILFDPHLVRSADYGVLSFSVHAPNLLVAKDACNSKTLTLPENQHRSYHASFGTQIAKYIYTIDNRRKIAPIVTIIVGLPASTTLSIPRSIDQRLEHALVDSMNGKEAVDVKFYAFTRRRAAYVARPEAIFAKALLLEGYSESLDILISGGGFTESRLVDLDGHNIDQDILEDYDYMSDSDLDTDDDEDEDDSTNRTLSDSDSLRDPAESIGVNIPLPLSRPATPGRRMGRVVIVRGTAFKTWKALLYYLYTSKLAFSIKPVAQVVADGYGAPACSAKSMYRLADKLGLDELKAASLSSIRASFSTENIVQAVFSKFTSIYPEVQDAEVEFLFLLDNFPALKEEVDRVLDGLCRGEQPHCVDVLRKIVAGRNSQPRPSSSRGSPGVINSPNFGNQAA